MNLRWIFPQNFSTLEQSVNRLNDALDRRLVTKTMLKFKVPREVAERVVRERVDAEVAKTMAKLELGVAR